MERLTKARFTNLDKVIYPDLRISKSKVIEYYIKIAPKILNFLEDRLLVTTRYPDGINKEGFYGKDAPKGTPSWVETFRRYSKTAKRNLDYIVCNNLDTLLWLANLVALELHIPLAKKDSYEKPDLILFDVDPEPPADINNAVEVAKLVKEFLDDFSLVSFVKTSGKKGFHIVVPIIPEHSYKITREFVHQIGKKLAKENKIIVSEFSRSQEPGTVYIDYGQNSSGKTMICPYSLRATKFASVSTPLDWKHLQKGLKPEEFNIFSVLESKSNPWKGFWDQKQRLEGN
ncbi:MAG: non-homologous end-joining DNA ligase [Candidatus Bathyarchaeota archaeon]